MSLMPVGAFMLQSLMMDVFPVPVKNSPSGILHTESNERRWIHPAHKTDARKESEKRQSKNILLLV